MTARVAALIVCICLCASQARAQAPPALTRQQRELLQAVITAVDSATAAPATEGAQWQTHLMRASDGSHYVAFAAQPPAGMALPPGPVLLYVRLASASGAPGVTAERSPIREWLAGQRVDPRMLPGRGIAIGEMPAFGAGAIGVRGSTPTTGSMDLKLMALERERARQEQEERDRQRRAELEGLSKAVSDVLPFEDFDLASRSARADGSRVIERAFTAGPGEYDLFLGWADPAASKPAATIRVLRRSLHLPTATAIGLTTGSIILADSITVRPAPYPASQQASHPYSIGLMEITPAPTSRYSRNDHLSVAFQVVNARSSDAGMPDVAIAFRIVRLDGAREVPVASLNPQQYNSVTLPPEFNLRIGHPLFVAVTAPLMTLTRGEYRLKIVVNDRLGVTGTAAEADFTIVGTPASLLDEAPALGRPFTRESALEATTRSHLVDQLTPPAASPGLIRALAIARGGTLVDLLVEEPLPATESGIRAALTGLGLLSIGEGSSAVQFQRALQEGGPAAPLQFLLGAARALQGRDAEAITAWQAARATGMAPPVLNRVLADALLRRGDVPGATVIAAASDTTGAAWARTLAAVHLANRRHADAITVIEAHLALEPDDREAQWLMLHALYARHVSSALPATERARFAEHARAYIDAAGANAALAGEWLRVINEEK